MSELNASIVTESTHYQPGGEIRGTVTWTTSAPPNQAELRLFWHTRGKGTQDAATIQVLSLAQPQASESRPFSFLAPEFPFSFSGKLISLIWGLELVLDPGGSKNIEIVIAPDGKEIDLHAPAPSKAPQSPWMPVS